MTLCAGTKSVKNVQKTIMFNLFLWAEIKLRLPKGLINYKRQFQLVVYS